MMKRKIIYVAGHRGLVGSAILQELKKLHFLNIITRTRKQLDLTNQQSVKKFFKKNKIDIVIIAAAKVGGIYSNQLNPSSYIYNNLMIQSNIIEQANKYDINDLILLGSSCIYPKMCKQPIKESYLLSGRLEGTNEAYAIAKIAGIKLCDSYNFEFKRRYRCLMPSNIYGENDNFDLKTSHFYPAIIRKLFESKISNSKTINLWGTGKAKRELIYVKDVAKAVVYFMCKKTKHSLINIGTGRDKTIKEYAHFLRDLIYPNVKIIFDKSTGDGTPRKLLDITVAKKYGWQAQTSLLEGTRLTINDFKKKNKKFNIN